MEIGGQHAAPGVWVCEFCGASNSDLTPDFCPVCGQHRLSLEPEPTPVVNERKDDGGGDWQAAMSSQKEKGKNGFVSAPIADPEPAPKLVPELLTEEKQDDDWAGWSAPTTKKKKKKNKKVLAEEVTPPSPPPPPRPANLEPDPEKYESYYRGLRSIRDMTVKEKKKEEGKNTEPEPETLEVKLAQPGGNMRDDEEGKKFDREKFGSRDSYEDWRKDTGLTFDREKRGDFLKNIHHISLTHEFKTKIDETLDTDSDSGSEVASIFTDGGTSASSTSTASLNPVQTTGIREVSRALLSQEVLKTLYTIAVRHIEQRKARAHIRGFLKEYSQNLLSEASNKSLEIEAAKFVQGSAGHIADEIGWSINGFDEVNRSLQTGLAKKDLETWLSSTQPGNVDIEEEPKPTGLAATVDKMFEDNDSDEELDNGLLFPNIDKVKDFLLNSEAFGTHVAAMRTWLKVDGGHDRDIEERKPVISEILEKPTGSIPVQADTAKVTEEIPADSAASELSQQQTEHSGEPSTKIKTTSQEDTAQEPELRSILRQNRGSIGDLVFGLLNFWGISFFFYDLVELFVPRVQPGYKRLRWRCVSLCVTRYSF
jgi:hypothetical protein